MSKNKSLLKQLPIDDNLTPENAGNQGYGWEGNVAYDRGAPLKEMQEIIELVDKEGYKLGHALSKMASGVLYGLYKPLREEHK